MAAIRKGINFRVLLWVEGQQEAAEDFCALTTRAVREAIDQAQAANPRLKFQIKSIEEHEGDDEDEDEKASGRR